MSIFSRAYHNQPLSPGERAFLKLFKGWVFSGVGGGLAAGAQVLFNGNADYQHIALVAGGAALLSVINAFDKYWSAQVDAPLAPLPQAAQDAPQSSQNANLTDQAAQPTSTTQPSVLMTSASPPFHFQPVNRHFGDSAVMPTVPVQLPPQPGQGQ